VQGEDWLTLHLIAFLVGAFANKRSAAGARCCLFLSLSLSLSLTLALQPAACISEYTVGCLPCSRDKTPAVVYRHLKALRSALRNESHLLQLSQSVISMEVLPCLSPSADFAPVSRCLPACTRNWDASHLVLRTISVDLSPHFSSLLAQKLSLVSPAAVETAARYSGVPVPRRST
jgi:hypothetical protein